MDRRPTLTLVALLLLTAAVYLPLRSAPFVYEDAHYVDAPVIWQVPGRPLSVLSVRMTGTSSGIAHMVNLAVHLVNGALVYMLGATLVGPAVGLIAAGLFLLHPVMSEGVSYVAARADLLVTLFALLATWLLLTWTTAAGWYRVVGASLALLGACLSKEIGLVAVPLVVFTLLVFRRTLPSTAFILNLLWGASGIAIGATWWHLSTWIGMPATGGGSVWAWPDFAVLQATALWRLLALIVWPVGLSIDHDVLALPAWSHLLALGLTAGMLAIAVWGWKRAPMLAFAIGWLLIAVAPRFIFATNEWIAERQIYPAMVGLCLLLSTLALKGCDGSARLHQL